MLRQMRYSGLFELIKIRKAGFMFRFTIEEFCGRYRLIAPHVVPPLSKKDVDWHAMAGVILSIVNENSVKSPSRNNAVPWVVGKPKSS